MDNVRLRRTVDPAVLCTDDGVSLLPGDDVLDFQPGRILRGVHCEEKGGDDMKE